MRDIVGAAVGMSGRTYERAKAVVDAAESGDAEADKRMRQGEPSGNFPEGSHKGAGQVRDIEPAHHHGRDVCGIVFVRFPDGNGDLPKPGAGTAWGEGPPA